ncbi:MAG: GDP-L-fucose synthase [Acidimicrobiia bacterium]
MERSARIFVAGHAGLVGSSLCRALRARGCSTLLTANRQHLDLRDLTAVRQWMRHERPEYVFMAAGSVGGIRANTSRPADFIYDNLAMQTAVVQASHEAGVRTLLMFGSSCMYPRDAAQPLREETLLTGPLEPTSEAYAVAKLAGLAMARAFTAQHALRVVTVIPATLYGPHDNFDLDSAHVPAALLHRFHLAKVKGDSEVTLWGTGAPTRDFLHVDDLAAACIDVMTRRGDPAPVNVGSGVEVAIRELAELIRDLVCPDVTMTFDRSAPDGTPRKVLDTSKARALGWQPGIPLSEGIRDTYRWFVECLDRGEWPRGTEPAHMLEHG